VNERGVISVGDEHGDGFTEQQPHAGSRGPQARVVRQALVERVKSGARSARAAPVSDLTRLEHRVRWLYAPGQGAKSAAVMPAG
jgi:hypothetical protein